MKPTFLDRSADVARALCLVASGLFLLGYVAIAVLRMGYPFELEWMEGGVLDHVRLAASGRAIFAAPSLEFVSFLYPPLYYYAAALPAKIFGMELHSLRLLSFLSSLGCLAWIVAMVRRQTGARVPGLLAAGLYVATFDRSGGWMDLARVDSFYMLLLLGGIYGVAFARSRPALVATAFSLAGAAMVKQSAIVIVAPLVLFAALLDRRRGAWWFGAFAGLLAVASFLLDRLHDGWFSYYCWTLPRQHPVIPGVWSRFWIEDIPPMLFALALGLVFLLVRSDAKRNPGRLFYLALAAGMVGSSWSVTSVVGAWNNNLMPAFAALSILAGLGLHHLSGRLAARPAYRAGLWLLILAQFAVLAYDPRDHLPTGADRAAGESLVRRISETPGEVFIPHHGYLAQRAGKPMQAHTLGMDNVFLDDQGPVGMALREELLEALGAQRYSVVIVESDGRYLPGVRPFYEETGVVFEDPDVFWPVTGGRLRPEYVFHPIRKP